MLSARFCYQGTYRIRVLESILWQLSVCTYRASASHLDWL